MTGTTKNLATLIAEFAIRGHVVHKAADGSFLVAKLGLVKHCANYAELQAFAIKTGVTKHE